MHVVVEEVNAVPAAQKLQVIEAIATWYFPDSQLEQLVTCGVSVGWYCPASQSLQTRLIDKVGAVPF
jgi:hypothetical protein